MSRFTVNLQDPPEQNTAAQTPDETPFSSNNQAAAPKKSSKVVKVLKILGISLLALILVAGIAGYFYWQSVKKEPSYSLALLVDAARRDDKEQMEQLVDTEAVIDDFMPQVTNKAIELYGRSLPPQAISRVQQVAAPAIPIIKERAKAELPRVIREKTEPVEKVPYWAIALFANRAVDISTQNDIATVKSKIPDRPLELTMKRDSDKWKVVALKDEILARKLAEKIGQEIIAAASKGGLKKAGEQFGVKNLEDLKKIDIFK